MSIDRQTKRLERRQKKAQAKALATADGDGNGGQIEANGARGSKASDEKFAKLLSQNEDDLLNFVAEINKLYQDKLDKPAPFVTFVICGMQSAGKSTIMERFMSAPVSLPLIVLLLSSVCSNIYSCSLLQVNIVQEGTGTRCPLDTTCIHVSSLSVPSCELSGKELEGSPRTSLTIEEAFVAITQHNRALANKDTFSSEPLKLVYRANNVQNMCFVDTPGIIANKGTGQDNRDAIKKILRDTMKKPRSKLCVLVEPKEFSTNAIIDFCDETFKSTNTGRDWKADAIVMMTKFDKQLEGKQFSQVYHSVCHTWC